jgi:hypothetical protein
VVYRSAPPPRLASAQRRRGRRWLLVTAIALSVIAGTGWWVVQRDAGPDALVLPEQFSLRVWDEALGGDQGMDEADYAALNDVATDPVVSGLEVPDARAATDVAGRVVNAELTGQGRLRWADYFAATGPAALPCAPVIAARSPAHLPVPDGRADSRRYAKVLVAWHGTCGTTSAAASAPEIVFVYLAENDGGWEPVPSASVPRRADADPVALGGVPDWALAPLGDCGGGTGALQARPEVVAAFDVMCRAAAADGVALVPTSAYRDPRDQQQRFEAAVEAYGSEAEARRWVKSPQGSVCTSRHCDGAAIDIDPSQASSLEWLGAVVGCVGGGQVVAAGACPSGARAVTRAERYGFAIPRPDQPWHLEYALPLLAVTGDCSIAAAAAIPEQIGGIWRCELRGAGIVGAEADTVARSAVAVARCASGWNEGWVVDGGEWVDVANPATGATATRAGVFALDRAVAGRYIEGGYARVADPVANITAAAQLWLAERKAGRDPWAYWAGCTSDLPAYGGSLPAWTLAY